MDNKFDSQQKHSGFNKYGHYQFGKHTCQYCKSDRTIIDGQWLVCEESECRARAYLG